MPDRLQGRLSRRLPGVRFEVVPPPVPELLPRMDVAAFVGFAASGPLDTPVAVEDVAHFEAVFGADTPLAWDGGRGEVAYAHLAPAVRAFFRNGGVRCLVVRVAGEGAATTTFAVPGLYRYVPVSGAVVPANVQARSPGSWADDLQISSSLESRGVEVIGGSADWKAL